MYWYKTTEQLLKQLKRESLKKENFSWRLSWAKSRKVWALDFPNVAPLEGKNLRNLLILGIKFIKH